MQFNLDLSLVYLLNCRNGEMGAQIHEQIHISTYIYIHMYVYIQRYKWIDAG